MYISTYEIKHISSWLPERKVCHLISLFLTTNSNLREKEWIKIIQITPAIKHRHHCQQYHQVFKFHHHWLVMDRQVPRADRREWDEVSSEILESITCSILQILLDKLHLLDMVEWTRKWIFLNCWTSSATAGGDIIFNLKIMTKKSSYSAFFRGLLPLSIGFDWVFLFFIDYLGYWRLQKLWKKDPEHLRGHL